MGLYVNPTNISFMEQLNDEIYVDKSQLLAFLNRKIRTPGKFLCVLRPRRFGKTAAESMIAAYYSKGCDSSHLFKDLKISKDSSYKENLNKYNVLHIDLNSFYSRYADDVNVRMTEEIVEEFKEEFPGIGLSGFSDIPACIIKAYKKTQVPFIVILDEYDVLVRDNAPKGLFEDYLRLLNAMFKSSSTSSCIALAYLTGIIPIVRDRFQSRPNNFDEYTIFSSPGIAGAHRLYRRRR